MRSTSIHVLCAAAIALLALSGCRGDQADTAADAARAAVTNGMSQATQTTGAGDATTAV